jgi:outer membrane protein TolC
MLKNFIVAICVILFAFAITAPVFSESVSLTLDGALSLTIENNSTFKQAAFSYGVAKQDADTVWREFLPAMSLSGRSTWSEEQDFSLSASMTLALKAGVPGTIRVSLAARDAARIVLEKTEADLIRQVRKKYFELLASAQTLMVTEKNLALAREQLSRVESNYRNGLASELEWLQSQYAAARLEPVLMANRQSLADGMRSLSILIGLPYDTALVLTDALSPAFPELAKPANLDELIEGRFDVRAAVVSLERAEALLFSGTLNRWAPTVTLSQSASAQGLQDEFRLPENPTFAVSVSIPLDGWIPGSDASLTHAENRLAVEKARLVLSDTRIAARKEIEELYGSLVQLREAIRINEFNQKIAARAHELSLEGYEAGLVTRNDLDEARQTLLEAELALLTARGSYQAGLIDLAYALHIDESALLGAGGMK